MTTLPRGLPRSRRQPPKEDQVQIVKASLGTPKHCLPLSICAPANGAEKPVPSS